VSAGTPVAALRWTDARLVLPAAACWLALLTVREWTPRGCFAACGVGVVSALALIAFRRPWRLAVAVALIAAAGASGVAGIHAAARATGPLAALARQGAIVEMTVQLASDAVRRSAVDASSGRTYEYVLARAQLTRLDHDGRQWAMRQPVLLIAPDRGWAGLLPSQRIRTAGRLSAPRVGDTVTAVVAIRGSPALIGEPSALQRVAGRVRAGLRHASTPLPGDAGKLLPGLVDGDTAALPPDVTADFRTTGLTHLVAVSGTNVGIVGGVALGLARRTRLRPGAAAAIAALCVVGFVVLARPSGSVLRAAVMGLLGLAGMATSRPRQALSGVCGAVIVLLLVEPALAVQPGFALSAFATLGLIVVAPGWAEWLERWWPQPVAVAVAVPAAAQVACAPLIAMIGGGLSLVAIPANLLAAPAVAPATVFGVCAAALAPVAPFLAGLCAWVAALPCLFLLAVARCGARVPYASVPWPDGWHGAFLMAALTPIVVGLLWAASECGRLVEPIESR